MAPATIQKLASIVLTRLPVAKAADSALLSSSAACEYVPGQGPPAEGSACAAPVDTEAPQSADQVAALKDCERVQAGSLWAAQPALCLVVRRPGCQLCREEAVDILKHEATLKKQGIKLFAVTHELLGSDEFQRDFWAGNELFIDENKDFFKAAASHGGYNGEELHSVNTVLGFFDLGIWPNVFRSSRKGVKGNFVGNGNILGGLFVVDKDHIEYAYHEKRWGDHAPIEDVLKACEKVSATASTKY
ncbi:hypothetical protein GQ42DRAFT_37540 [Ramicandelaber brevisporus]|nr:hypothetical protein GQ42DRAFT_37540 [Ramicandelaber brevisporus]